MLSLMTLAVIIEPLLPIKDEAIFNNIKKNLQSTYFCDMKIESLEFVEEGSSFMTLYKSPTEYKGVYNIKFVQNGKIKFAQVDWSANVYKQVVINRFQEQLSKHKPVVCR